MIMTAENNRKTCPGVTGIKKSSAARDWWPIAWGMAQWPRKSCLKIMPSFQPAHHKWWPKVTVLLSLCCRIYTICTHDFHETSSKVKNDVTEQFHCSLSISLLSKTKQSFSLPNISLPLLTISVWYHHQWTSYFRLHFCCATFKLKIDRVCRR